LTVVFILKEKSMRRFALVALALAALAVPATVEAQARPVIAVLPFDNNSIGKDRTDFDGIGRGMADMLITDMASNTTITVVERERIQALLTEQNLVKSGTIDPQTAIKLGKMIGAQYMITGGFMSDGRGTYVLTARAISVTTSAIMNPVRLTTKGDDVLGLMSQLSTRLNSEMRLPAVQVGDAGAPAATPAGQPSHAAAPAKADERAHADAKPAAAAPAVTKAAAPSRPAQQVAQAERPKGKMDMRTALLYSKALEEDDAGNRAKAVELYRQVVARFPLPAAQAKIDKYTRG
jgi:TolB-like protein